MAAALLELVAAASVVATATWPSIHGTLYGVGQAATHTHTHAANPHTLL